MREKILRSLNTSDLSDERWENASHVIASLGASQIGRKHLSTGSYLLHLRAGHARFLPRILALLSLQIISRARRNSWKGINRHNAPRLAEVSLDRYLNALCEMCNGVGTIGELGGLIDICPDCRGSAKRRDNHLEMAEGLNISLRAFRDLGLIERIKDVVNLLDRMEGLAAGATKIQARG